MTNDFTISAKNIFSQHGEDGIIREIFERIPELNYWCVEFGAWDGKHLSNSRNLIVNYNYNAILVEGDQRKFKSLKCTYKDNTSVHYVNKYVGFHDYDGLDSILANYQIPANFDFLSVDIDGNDYHVWHAMKNYKPKVVCIEFNPSIPKTVEFVQEANPDCNQGSSLLSLVNLAKDKGYELVCVKGCNVFFIANELYNNLGIKDNSIESINDDSLSLTYIYYGYDGKIFVTGKAKLPWHNILLNQKNIQILPKYLRRIPYRYNFFQKIIYLIYLLFNNPEAVLIKLKKEIF